MERRQSSFRAAPAGLCTEHGRIRYDLEITSVRESVFARVDVPRDRVPLSSMIPIFHRVTDIAVHVATRDEEAKGKTVSCAGTCTSCCRRLVPLSVSEARYLARFVDLLPAEKLDELRERFERAVDVLSEQGLLDRLRASAESTDTRALTELANEYMRAGVPCPFLSGNTCGIHEHRPLSCRERAVLAKEQGSPDPADVDDAAPNPHPEGGRLPLPARPSRALLRLQQGAASDERRWLPLILLLEWATRDDSEDPDVSRASAHFEKFLRELAAPPGTEDAELALAALECS